jgi:hypothetical protein
VDGDRERGGSTNGAIFVRRRHGGRVPSAPLRLS